MSAFRPFGLSTAQRLVLILVAVIASACSRTEPIVVASHVWLGYEPMFLARSKGWLDAEQVSLLETAAASDSLAALQSGRVDGAALTLDEVIQARAMGLDLRVVLVFNLSVGADVLLARPPLQNLAELRGRRVGFEHGAVGHLVVVMALAQAGLSLADVTAIDLPMEAQLAAWDDGLLDALASYEPTASRLRAAGATVVFDSSEIPEAIVDVLAFRNDRLNASTDAAVRHLIAAHLRALEYVQNNPEDAAHRMARRLDLPVNQVLPAFRGLVLPDLMNNYRLLHGDPAPLVESSRNLVEFKLAHGLLDEEVDLDSLLQPEWLPRIGQRSRAFGQ